MRLGGELRWQQPMLNFLECDEGSCCDKSCKGHYPQLTQISVQLSDSWYIIMSVRRQEYGFP